jgi:DNA polymerase sigma
MHLKIRLWKEIYRALRQEFDCGLFVFGSTFNGFGLEESDMDMCLLVQETGGDNHSVGRLTFPFQF